MSNSNSEILRILPLGGLGEGGKNMMAYEYNDHILVVVDAGLMFPDNDMLGVDYIIPDFEYLRKNAARVDGIIITHGHEDHIGAIQHLLVDVPAPVYATPLTRADLVETCPQWPFEFGPSFSLSRLVRRYTSDRSRWKPSMSATRSRMRSDWAFPPRLAWLSTPCHGKFDQTPVDNWPTDFAKLAEFSARGVDVLLADLTYSERPGWSCTQNG